MVILPLATSTNRTIFNYRPDALGEWTQEESEDLRDETLLQFNTAIIRREPSRMFNCHGMTFANRRTRVQGLGQSLVDIIDNTTTLLKNILSDDNYREVDLGYLEAGDIVVYRSDVNKSILHTGLVYQVDTPFGDPTTSVLLVLSKWGENGEYLHGLHETPYVDAPDIEFWTERTTT